MITDASGNLIEKRQFDALGNIITVANAAGTLATPTLTFLERGYTGHEHLQGVGLVNMNARLYDPILHRFLSPDAIIQDPGNTQDYNRYAYVANNPLKYTDPSGNYRPNTTSAEDGASGGSGGFTTFRRLGSSIPSFNAGGGTGVFGGGFTSSADFWRAVNVLMNSADGGTSSGYANGSTMSFDGPTSAFNYGYAEMSANGWLGSQPGFATSYSQAVFRYDSDPNRTGNVITLGSNSWKTIGGYYHDSNGKPTTINGVSGAFQDVYVGPGTYKTGWTNLNKNHEASEEKSFMENAEETLKPVDHGILFWQTVGLASKNIMNAVEHSPAMQLLGKTTGVINIYNNLNTFRKNPFSINGLTHLGEAGVQTFLMANPEWVVAETTWNLTTMGVNRYILNEK